MCSSHALGRQRPGVRFARQRDVTGHRDPARACARCRDRATARSLATIRTTGWPLD